MTKVVIKTNGVGYAVAENPFNKFIIRFDPDHSWLRNRKVRVPTSLSRVAFVVKPQKRLGFGHSRLVSV